MADYEEASRNKRRRLDVVEVVGRFVLIENAFQTNLLTYYYKNDCDKCVDLANLLRLARENIMLLLAENMRRFNGIKFNILIELTYCKPHTQESKDIGFKTRNIPIFSFNDIEDAIDEAYQMIVNEEVNFVNKGSGWTLVSVDGILVRINKYNPLRGSSFIPLPKNISSKKAIINIQNNDDYCFMWSILCKFVEGTNRHRVDSRYQQLLNKFNFTGISFPTPLKDVKTFERLNENVSVNVFGLDKESMVVPIRISEREKGVHFDLMLLKDGEAVHYCYIENFNRLVSSQLSKDGHKIEICKRCFTSYRKVRDSERKMGEHLRLCRENAPAKILLPKVEKDGKKPIIKFKNYHHMFPVPIVCYADFECILRPVHTCFPSPKSSFSVSTAHHEPMSFCLYFVLDSSVPKFIRDVVPSQPVIYRDQDAAREFMRIIREVALNIVNCVKVNVPMIFTEEDRERFSSEKNCQMCNLEFNTDNTAVRDHCHLTGVYRAALCTKCNLQRQNQNFLPVFIHYASNYDSHFIVRELGYDTRNITVIPNSREKYITFSKSIVNGFSLKFVDTYRFMQASLDSLVSTLNQECFINIKKHFKEEDIPFVTRKGVYPYEYTSSWEILNESSLPPKECFYSELVGEHISEKDYIHAQNVWDHFKIMNLGEYSDLYLKTDVLLLADVFENYRKIFIMEYGLDCAYYLTAPGFAYDAMLYKTRVELELITEYDMYLFLENGIRGGLSVCVNKHSIANNPYISEIYDEGSPRKYIIYLDANNLYGWAMSKPLPHSNFRWVRKDMLETIVENIFHIDDDGDIGFIMEVDIEYPEDLHVSHSDLPFLPSTTIPPGSTHSKLIASVESKKNYICHFVLLKQAIQAGLKVVAVHRILQFHQEPWLRSYIDFNTRLRQEAKDDFGKNLFKLMNNAVFGKCMENIRKRKKIELVSNPDRLTKLISKVNFKDRIIYSENLCAVECDPTSIMLNKAIYAGLSILEISKWLMYYFHYKVMHEKYGSNLKMLYMDTDGIIYEIITEDVYRDMCQKDFSDHFDMSDYPPDHICYSLVNKKVLGKFKDECGGEPISEFIGLRAKLYAFQTKDKVVKKAKGIKKNIVKKQISIQDYKNVLLDETVEIYRTMNCFISKKHQITTVLANKLALNNFDDKRVAIDKVTTLPWGHKDIPLELKRMYNQMRKMSNG